MALSVDGRSTRLRFPDDAYVTCLWCKRTVIGKVGHTLCGTCEYERDRFEEDREAVKGLRDMMCRECGVWFNSRRTKFCSQECYVKYKADQALGLARAAAEQLDLGTATGWLHRLFQFLALRDGGDCYLCGRNVNLSLKSGPSGSRQGSERGSCGRPVQGWLR